MANRKWKAWHSKSHFPSRLRWLRHQLGVQNQAGRSLKSHQLSKDRGDISSDYGRQWSRLESRPRQGPHPHRQKLRSWCSGKPPGKTALREIPLSSLNRKEKGQTAGGQDLVPASIGETGGTGHQRGGKLVASVAGHCTEIPFELPPGDCHTGVASMGVHPCL